MKVNTILLILIVLTACKQGKNNKPVVDTLQEISLQQDNLEGISLFDGQTLDGWEITNFGTQGPVMVSEGSIVMSYGEGCTGVTYTKDFPKINYEVYMEARRVSGNDFFCGITFPVDTTFCSFIVGGWSGPVVGLSTIDRLDASENETKTLKNFETGRWYKIKLRVTSETIKAWIDNEIVVDFEIGEHKIGIRPEVGLSRPFGVATWYTTGEIRNIRLKINE